MSPRTVIPVTTATRAGVTAGMSTVYADITNNHYVADNDGRIFFILANVSNASSVNVTFDVAAVYDGDLTIVDLIVALAPAARYVTGFYKTGVFNQTDSSMNINVGSTGISFEAYRISS